MNFIYSLLKSFYRTYLCAMLYWFGQKTIDQGTETWYDFVLGITNYMFLPIIVFILNCIYKVAGHPQYEVHCVVAVFGCAILIGSAYYVKWTMKDEMFFERLFEEWPQMEHEYLKKCSRISLYIFIPMLVLILPALAVLIHRL